MLKHIDIEFSETGLTYTRNEESITQEAALDCFYIVRSGRITAEEMDADKLVETYKSLSQVERAFRAMKTTALDVRPIFHHEDAMVRAHTFMCMLACHLRWQLESQLKPPFFNDEEPGGAPCKSSVAKAKRSRSADTKAATKKAEDEQPVHSLATLMEDLSTLCRITVSPVIKGTKSINKLTNPTAVQARIPGLLGVTPKAM